MQEFVLKNKIILKNPPTCETVATADWGQSAVQCGFAEHGPPADEFDAQTVQSDRESLKRTWHHLLWGQPLDPLPEGHSPKLARLLDALRSKL
jgi:hypothetical protein